MNPRLLHSCSVALYFVAFVYDGTTMSLKRYFENHVSHLMQYPKEEDPIKPFQFLYDK